MVRSRHPTVHSTHTSTLQIPQLKLRIHLLAPACPPASRPTHRGTASRPRAQGSAGAQGQLCPRIVARAASTYIENKQIAHKRSVLLGGACSGSGTARKRWAPPCRQHKHGSLTTAAQQSQNLQGSAAHRHQDAALRSALCVSTRAPPRAWSGVAFCSATARNAKLGCRHRLPAASSRYKRRSNNRIVPLLGWLVGGLRFHRDGGPPWKCDDVRIAAPPGPRNFPAFHFTFVNLDVLDAHSIPSVPAPCSI